jgi:hypothetical protein
MDVRLSPEQRALRDSAAQVVARLAPSAVGQFDDAERVAKLDAAVAATGWRELRTAKPTTAGPGHQASRSIVAEGRSGLADTAFGPAHWRPAPAGHRRGAERSLTADLSGLAVATAGAIPGDAVAVGGRRPTALLLRPTGGG